MTSSFTSIFILQRLKLWGWQWCSNVSTSKNFKKFFSKNDLSPCKQSKKGSLLKSGTKKFHPPVYWVPLGVCDSVTLFKLCPKVLRAQYLTWHFETSEVWEINIYNPSLFVIQPFGKKKELNAWSKILNLKLKSHTSVTYIV